MQENRDAALADFLVTVPDVDAYSERLRSYVDLLAELRTVTVGTDVLWIRVDTSPLCNSLEKEALKWLHVFGEAFVEWIGQQVDLLREFLEKTHDEVHKPVTALLHLSGMRV